MQITVTSGAPKELHAGALVVPVFADGRLDGAAHAADAALGGAVADVFARVRPAISCSSTPRRANRSAC